jgi:general secretion pathway protein F
MPAYRFEAIDAAGKASSGLLEADNAKAARAQLRAQALVPMGVTQVASAGTQGAGSRCGHASSPAWSAPACRSSGR